MPGLNKCMMIGNLTGDPKLSYTTNQTAVADFSLASNRKWTNADGTKQESTCFIDCRAYGKTAENVNKYLAKGSLIYVEGHLEFEKWDQDGHTRTKHRLVVDSGGVQFLTPKANGQSKPAGDVTMPDAKPVPDSDIPF